MDLIISYLECENIGSQLFTLWKKKKEDDYYFEPEKLLRSYLEIEINGPQLFEAIKFGITPIQNPKIVSYCYLETENTGSQLFRA